MDDQVHGAQHIGQHMVGLDLEVVAPEFDLHMPVAEVVGSARQIKGAAVLGARGDAQHRLRCGDHADERAVGGDQHITAAHCGAARQKHAQAAALGVGGVKAAFLAHVPVELDGGGTFDQHGCETRALGDEFGDLQHGAIRPVLRSLVPLGLAQNRK